MHLELIFSGYRRLWHMMRMGLFVVGFLFGGLSAFAQQTIRVDSRQTGRIFEGIGALSAGASSRLLIDYPEAERSKVLDLLFKPRYGASLHHLKIEVGGEVNSTDGSEPSHARSREEMLHPKREYFQRGYEWWLMTEAKKRNPRIMLDALAWGAPGWIGGGEFYSQDMADYYAAFIKGMKKYHGLDIDYLGIWNETKYKASWIKLLRQTLDGNELTSVKIVAADQCKNQYGIAEDMKSDPELNRAIAVLGDHYPERMKGRNYQSSETAQQLSKPIWNAEGGSWKGDWKSFPYFAKLYNRCYIEGKMTKVITWSLVSSYYDILSIPSSGPMRANVPWCGYFEIQPALWAIAHTTQFAQPGWKYIDSGCGYLPDNTGSFVTLLKPSGQGDYSIIIETMDATETQNVTFKMDGDFSAKQVAVWRSLLDKETFVRQTSIMPKDGTFTITLQPKALYSLTTTTGQKKGIPVSPPRKPFPLPYKTDFEDERVGRAPKYFSDIVGVFDVVDRPDGMGKCLRQTVRSKNIFWIFASGPENSCHSTILGERKWSDYRVSTDVLVEEPGFVAVLGRLSFMNRGSRPPNGYWFQVDTSGEWKLNSAQTVLANGNVEFPEKTWHRLQIGFRGNTVAASINGSEVCKVTQTEKRDKKGRRILFKRGLAGIGTGYNRALFDNFAVEKH
ncbi:MAG: family 16 glycoside hydrolase [Planctomycetota bacterium]|jgi:galactosylceramidase